MIAVDSSVAIATFGEWHDLNPPACAVLDEGAAIPIHVLGVELRTLDERPA